ncbi:ATP-binding protein [Marinobacter sp.]|uniref:ATP-binding protein n=1 Tax=Marinobacter sp. TaxID=50741 RepID=UPI0034A1BB0F
MQAFAEFGPEKFPCGCLVTTGPGTPGDRMIVFANPYFYNRLGFTSGTLVGQALASVLTPASRIILDSFMLPMLKHEGKVEEILLEILSSDAERVPVVVNAVIDRPGEEYIYWSLFRAVQRDKLYKELNQTRDMAEEANRAKSRFLSSMSHELRTPMNAILGFSQIMKADPAFPESHRSGVDEIIKAGHHLLELINEVLDLARVEAGQIDLSLEPVPVTTAIEGVLRLVRPLADKRGIQCRLTGTANLGVIADRTRLNQVLLNLVSNAIKYNRDGGEVTVNVQRVQENNHAQVRLSISDTGPGIDPEDLAGLAAPFHRLQSEDSGIEGTGIGLTITRQIVKAMDGTLGISSKVGAGSTFWIELPECQPKVPVPETPAEKPAADSAAAPQQPSDIVLYIEDNPVNLMLVEQFIRRHGKARMVPADSPEKGIELATTLKPAVILLDLSMPEMDGFQVLEILKAKPALAGVPIIAMTAHALPADIQRGKAAGFDDYLTKPLKLKHFFQVLDRYLAG